MAVELTTVLFILFTTQAWASEVMVVVGVVDELVYLSPSLQGTYPQIHWRRNDTVKIASREHGEEVQYPNSGYKGRLELFPNNTLKISCLQRNDTSMYQVYLEDDKGKEYIESIFLKVYDLVPKPTVSARVISNSPELCKASLECSVELKEVNYEWILPTKLPEKVVGASKQVVSFNPSSETYICKVSNPISSNNASLTYRPPCSWTADSPNASSCITISVPMVLGHLLLLFCLLTLT